MTPRADAAIVTARATSRTTRTEQLQVAWDKRPVEIMDAEIVFRPFRGWYAQPMEGRWFNDDGDYLGPNWKAALAEIRWILRIEVAA